MCISCAARARRRAAARGLARTLDRTLNVRRLIPQDAEHYQAARLRGLLECPSAFASSHAEEAATPIEEMASRLAYKPDGAVFGHFSGSGLQGVVGIQREGMLKLAHKAFIWGMYVLPEVRMAGVGRALLEHALDFAQKELGVRQVNLGVNTENTAALALYRRVGFEVYGTERGFLLVDGVLYDEHHMAWRVRSAA